MYGWCWSEWNNTNDKKDGKRCWGMQHSMCMNTRMCVEINAIYIMYQALGRSAHLEYLVILLFSNLV